MLSEFTDGATLGVITAAIVAVFSLVIRRGFAGATTSWLSRLVLAAVPVAVFNAILVAAFGGDPWSAAKIAGNAAGLFVGYSIAAPIIRARVSKIEAAPIAIEHPSIPEELDDTGNPLPGCNLQDQVENAKKRQWENYPKKSS